VTSKLPETTAVFTTSYWEEPAIRGRPGNDRSEDGFAIDKTLIYGTGGLALADISHTYKNLSALTTEKTSGFRTGWTVGAGVEMASPSICWFERNIVIPNLENIGSIRLRHSRN
jgi:hypothetical protein